jgi:hypothetical protein
MVTAKTQYSLRNAQDNFEEHLAVGDYYDERQRVSGQWWGTGAERLALSRNVRVDDFLELCGNQNPVTGETLTQRLNDRRVEGDGTAANRRVFYDFTISRPKSVSLAAFLGSDDRFAALHQEQVTAHLFGGLVTVANIFTDCDLHNALAAMSRPNCMLSNRIFATAASAPPEQNPKVPYS